MSGGEIFVRLWQVASGLIWLGVVIMFRPVILRAWRQQADHDDWMVLGYPAIGFVQVGFTLRWVFFPHAIAGMGVAELLDWSGLYFMSGLTGWTALIAFRAWGKR